jgi:hypothetical protein
MNIPHILSAEMAIEIGTLKHVFVAGCLWLTSVTLDMQETLIRRIAVQFSAGQILSQSIS